MDSIFIQIAAFRDPQLIPTIEDALNNADDAKRLVFGICRQYNLEDSFDNLDKYRDDPRFRIIDVLDVESKGVCWARNRVQSLYKDEKYTLQLDSHHRFEKGWDTMAVQWVKALQKRGHKKPLITAYLSSFNPDNDPEERAEAPFRMYFDRFTPEGIVFFIPENIPNWKEEKLPVPARFYSAHFAFTLGKFCKEVPHDPNYYFHGEEISIAARAYTHGYDLFHPHRLIAYHEYTRRGRVKQWDVDKDWGIRNTNTHKRNRILFGMEEGQIDFGIYGFGKERSLKDYEEYAGIQFKTRGVQQYTLDRQYPPNPKYSDEKQYNDSFIKLFKHCIDIGYDQVPEKDYSFWVVALHDANDNTLFRRDVQPDEIKTYFEDPDKYCKVWVEAHLESMPKYWVVWPHSISKGWCDRITQDI